jgi:hypothetical protein
MRFLILALFCLLAGIFIFSRFSSAENLGFESGGLSQSFPGPELFYPITDDIDLKGKSYLEFKWRRSDFVYTRSYDFRLYKGYQAIASNLILKRVISTNDYPFKVESLVFDPGQVYTWVLRQVTLNGRKSDKSSSSFKVIKK